MQMATGEHQFSLEDLTKMFNVANTRNKALLAVGVSLGWTTSMILDMERKYFQDLVNKAKAEGKEFISFRYVRPKTQASIFGILNPNAIEYLGQYLERIKDNEDTRLWGLNEDTLTDILRSLAQEAGIVTAGRIHWHMLRKFLMTQLDRAGLTEWQVKYILGKVIPISDATYLGNQEDTTLKKYQQAFKDYLSLTPSKKQIESDELLGILSQTQIDTLKRSGWVFERNKVLTEAVGGGTFDATIVVYPEKDKDLISQEDLTKLLNCAGYPTERVIFETVEQRQEDEEYRKTIEALKDKPEELAEYLEKDRAKRQERAIKLLSQLKEEQEKKTSTS